MSWHIWVVIRRNADGTGWDTRIYIYIFDELSSQDSGAVLSTLKDVIKRIHLETPRITKAYLRSDNAGCYHSATTLASVIDMNKDSIVKILRWDFSEPQQGKDACDRYAAIIKRKVRQFVVGNRKCETPAEFQTAASSHGGSPAVSIIRGIVVEKSKQQKKPKIAGISFLTNFEFNDDTSIRAWRAYNIGPGKIIPYSTLQGGSLDVEFRVSDAYHQGQHEIEMPVTDEYWKPLTRKYKKKECANRDEPTLISAQTEPTVWECPDALDTAQEQEVVDEESQSQKLYPCPEPGCTKTYKFEGNLVRHLTLGTHHFQVERETLKDAAIGLYEEAVEHLQVHADYSEISDVVRTLQDSSAFDLEDLQPPQEMGWALKSSRKKTMYTDKQHGYLIQLFDQGIQQKRKCDPKVTSKAMQTSTEPVFDASEYLASAQIASYWSNLKRKRETEAAGSRQRRSPTGDSDNEELQQNQDVWEVYGDEYLETLEIFPDLEEELLTHFQQEENWCDPDT